MSAYNLSKVTDLDVPPTATLVTPSKAEYDGVCKISFNFVFGGYSTYDDLYWEGEAKKFILKFDITPATKCGIFSQIVNVAEQQLKYLLSALPISKADLGAKDKYSDQFDKHSSYLELIASCKNQLLPELCDVIRCFKEEKHESKFISRLDVKEHANYNNGYIVQRECLILEGECYFRFVSM